jgi:ADP-ribose pyrophosphatase
MKKSLLERLAALEHEQRAAWTRDFLENASPENRARGQRLVETPYDALSDADKESARASARRVLEVLAEGDDAGVLFEGKHLVMKATKTPTGTWEFVERKQARGIVAILAITERDEIIIVEQFRVPVGRRVIEIPAGLAGDIAGEETEDLAHAARRELREETGYDAETLELLTEGPPSAGLSTEIITYFRARGLKKVGPGGGDSSEDIDVHLVPLADLDAWIAAKRAEGCLVDYKIYAGLYFHLRDAREK